MGDRGIIGLAVPAVLQSLCDILPYKLIFTMDPAGVVFRWDAD
jgi:hypothetical protein